MEEKEPHTHKASESKSAQKDIRESDPFLARTVEYYHKYETSEPKRKPSIRFSPEKAKRALKQKESMKIRTSDENPLEMTENKLRKNISP